MSRLAYAACLLAVFTVGVAVAPWFRATDLSSGAQMLRSLSGPDAVTLSGLPMEEEGLLTPRNIGLALIFIYGVVLYSRRRRTQREREALQFAAPHHGNDNRDIGGIVPAQAAPRALLENPYGSQFDGLDFESRVQCAIEASLRQSRVIGVIHLGLARAGANLATNGELNDHALEMVAQTLRRKIRASDCVRVSGNGQVEVFISLLETRDHLQRISLRLAQGVRELQSETGLALAYQPGCAMYPLDGYCASELSDAAREDALSLQVDRNTIASVPSRSPARLYPGISPAA